MLLSKLHNFHFCRTNCETIECLPISVNFFISKDYTVERVNCVLTGLCKDCS